MKTPYNVIDAQRIRRLLTLVDEHPETAELKLYVDRHLVKVGPERWEGDDSRAYLSMEIVARELPMQEVRAILAMPMEVLDEK